MRRYLLLASGLALGWVLASALYLGGHLTRPHRVVVGPPPQKLPAEAVSLESGSGARLSGWFVPSPAKRGGVLLLHGLRSDRRETLSRALFLHEAGYSVLMVDLQAHGESTGERMTFGYLEGRDAEAAFEYLRRRIPGQPVGVIGISLAGTAAVLGTVSQSAHALVLEAVYSDIATAVGNRIEIRVGAWARHLAPLLLWQFEPRIGVDPALLAPVERIGAAKAAVLVIAGTHDRRTTLVESHRLYARAPEPKALWTIAGARHEDFHRFDPGEYERRVLRFFARYLREDDGDSEE